MRTCEAGGVSRAVDQECVDEPFYRLTVEALGSALVGSLGHDRLVAETPRLPSENGSRLQWLVVEGMAGDTDLVVV
jgi:hypothetical protein